MFLQTSVAFVLLATLTFANSESPVTTETQNTTISESCEIQAPNGLWSALLEEWATSTSGEQCRHGRVMALPQTTGYYVTERNDILMPPPPPRGYDEWLGPPLPAPASPGKVVNRPPNPYKDQFKPSYPPPQPPPQNGRPSSPPSYRPPAPHGGANSIDRVDAPARKEVSETDLFLLGAIEKLVYRVDLMEKRLRKMEESLHYIVAGQDKAPEPCVSNFTRIAGSCYHFSPEPLDWKNANLACRKLRSNLLELDSDSERRQFTAAVQASKAVKDLDWWTAGLNPGLLWIWSHSGRPVVTNASASNGTGPAGGAAAVHIVGEGRCLALVYDPAVRNYAYRGQDCSLRHRFVCEKEEDKAKLSNEIERVARQLRDGAARGADGARRRPKIVWTEDDQ